MSVKYIYTVYRYIYIYYIYIYILLYIYIYNFIIIIIYLFSVIVQLKVVFEIFKISVLESGNMFSIINITMSINSYIFVLQ